MADRYEESRNAGCKDETGSMREVQSPAGEDGRGGKGISLQPRIDLGDGLWDRLGERLDLKYEKNEHRLYERSQNQ